MESIIYQKNYDAPIADKREILRYAGVRGDAPEISALLEDCLDEISGCLSYRVCFMELPVMIVGDTVDLGFAKTKSAALGRHICGCGSVILFAATLGIAADRMIFRYSSKQPSRSLMMQAICTERIESLADEFCRDIERDVAERGLFPRSRFSPGYGDLPLELQRDIFGVLDCSRRIGLSLNESLLMSPTKSVTAIIGLSAERVKRESGCGSCDKTNCEFRC